MNKLIPETKLTLLAKEAQKKHNFALILVIAVLIQIVASIPQVIIMLPITLLSSDRLGTIPELSGYARISIDADTVILVNLFCTVFCIIFTLIYCTKIEKRSLKSLGFRGKTPALEYLVGLVIGTAMLLIAWGICLATGSAVCVGLSPSISPILLLFLLGFMVQGMSEEVLCRGYVMQSTSIRYAAIVAILLNAVFFAALHLGNNSVSVLPIVNIFLFGVFASLYMWKRGNIWGIAALHTSWNFAQGNLVGIRVSGNYMGPTVLQTKYYSSGALINGGDFGIEGGIACTIVFVVGIIILLLIPVRADARCAE